MKIAVQVQGAGPALLLLAGQANSHRWWNLVRPDFVADRTTITFDYRGTGSSGDSDECSTRLFASDAASVLDYLGIASADVYGTSMGGRVAQWLAVDAPNRVGRLILGCTTPGGSRGVQAGRVVLQALIAGDATEEVLADLMYSPAYRRVHGGPHATLGDPTMSGEARQRHLRASNEHDAWNALPHIAADTLILHGADDQLIPVANARLLADRIPRARLHEFAGARHAYFEECRAQASRIALRFLATGTH